MAQFDLQGHRGCRGELPENTIPAFLRAVDAGVTTLELDVVITSDHKVLVSHEPFMSHTICGAPSGEAISKKTEKSHNIYKMTSAEAVRYNCGETVNKRFPQQQLMKAGKPLLEDVIDSVENYIAAKGLAPVGYNIETKCTPEGDQIFHPGPEIFAGLLLDVVTKKNITDRTWIQSFDVRTLQYLKNSNAPVKLVLLVGNIKGVKRNIKNLGFHPDVYSPSYRLVRKKDITWLHAQNIRIIPWTVNSHHAMLRLKRMGVDGIITDYPTQMKTYLEAESGN